MKYLFSLTALAFAVSSNAFPSPSAGRLIEKTETIYMPETLPAELIIYTLKEKTNTSTEKDDRHSKLQSEADKAVHAWALASEVDEVLSQKITFTDRVLVDVMPQSYPQTLAA